MTSDHTNKEELHSAYRRGDYYAAELKKLQAENAALKEQVAQLEAADSAVQLLKDKTITSLYDQLTALQSKSAALVDALGSIKHSMDMGLMLGNDKRRELLLSQSIAEAALAAFKGEK